MRKISAILLLVSFVSSQSFAATSLPTSDSTSVIPATSLASTQQSLVDSKNNLLVLSAVQSTASVNMTPHGQTYDSKTVTPQYTHYMKLFGSISHIIETQWANGTSETKEYTSFHQTSKITQYNARNEAVSTKTIHFNAQKKYTGWTEITYNGQRNEYSALNPVHTIQHFNAANQYTGKTVYSGSGVREEYDALNHLTLKAFADGSYYSYRNYYSNGQPGYVQHTTEISPNSFAMVEAIAYAEDGTILSKTTYSYRSDAVLGRSTYQVMTSDSEVNGIHTRTERYLNSHTKQDSSTGGMLYTVSTGKTVVITWPVNQPANKTTTVTISQMSFGKYDYVAKTYTWASLSGTGAQLDSLYNSIGSALDYSKIAAQIEYKTVTYYNNVNAGNLKDQKYTVEMYKKGNSFIPVRVVYPGSNIQYIVMNAVDAVPGQGNDIAVAKDQTVTVAAGSYRVSVGPFNLNKSAAGNKGYGLVLSIASTISSDRS